MWLIIENSNLGSYMQISTIKVEIAHISCSYLNQAERKVIKEKIKIQLFVYVGGLNNSATVKIFKNPS